MSFGLLKNERVEDVLRNIVRRQLRRPISVLASDGRALENAIHESRKSVKKVRAVAALMEEAGAKLPRKDRKRLKSAARSLSGLRDSAVIIEILELVRRRYPKQLPEHTFGILRRHLVDSRDQQVTRAIGDGVMAESAAQLAKARKAARTWKSPSIDASDLVPIITASYRRSRKVMKRAQANRLSATLHTWRKELKTLWYQLRLIEPLAGGLSPLLANLKRLETDLGDDHNLVVLQATLRGCRDLRPMRDKLREIGRLAARMRQPLRRRAFKVARRVYARKPKAFSRAVQASMKTGTRRAA